MFSNPRNASKPHVWLAGALALAVGPACSPTPSTGTSSKAIGIDEQPTHSESQRLLLTAQYHDEPDETFTAWPVAQLVHTSGTHCTGFMIGPRILMTSATCAPVSRLTAVFGARQAMTGAPGSRVGGAVAFEATATCHELMTHHLIPEDLSQAFFRHEAKHNSDTKLFHCGDLNGLGLPPGTVFGYLDFDLRDAQVDDYTKLYEHGFAGLDGFHQSPRTGSSWAGRSRRTPARCRTRLGTRSSLTWFRRASV